MDTSMNSEQIAAVIDRLERQYPDVPAAEVVAVIVEAHDAFHDYPIATQVPVIVERQARDRLKGRAGGRLAG